MISFHVEDVLMASKTETLKNTKEIIKEKFNISESGKVRKFLRVYYVWGRKAKGTDVKTTMEKDVNMLV